MASALNSTINIFLWYFSWWVIPLLVLFVYRKMLGKYPIIVTIYEKRGDNIIYSNDVAGRFDNPIAHYKLKKTKDIIPIPQYDWVLQSMYKPTNLFETISNFLAGKIGHITLFKYSSKQYKPVRVRMADGSIKEVIRQVKKPDGELAYETRYEYINPRQSMSKLDFEVIDWDDINHMTQELRAIALRRAPLKDFMEKYGHWIAFGLAVMALIIAGYYYKDIVTSATCYQAPPTQQTAPTTEPPATQPAIPIIGDLIPGK